MSIIELTRAEWITVRRGIMGTIARHDLSHIELRQDTLSTLYEAGIIQPCYPDCETVFVLSQSGKRVLELPLDSDGEPGL